MAELHTHTTFSDGTLTPGELVEEAVSVRLSTLAVTDHDTIQGVAPAREAARDLDLEIVSGIEFSSNLDAHEVHILGLFVDDQGEELQSATRDSRGFRRQRAEEIVERLRGLDVGIEFSSVEKAAGSGSMGRPHIAIALVHHGAVATVDEAFGRYIGVGRPGFVPKPTLDAEEVVEVVHRAGGVAILAHPASSRLREVQILRLADLGVDGFEVEHPNHSASAATKLRKLAESTGLLPSSGSDYHGPGAGQTKLGQHAVSHRCLEALREAAASHRHNTASKKDEQ